MAANWKPSIEAPISPSNGTARMTRPVPAARKKISIVTSAYNEGECIDELARRLTVVFDSMPAYDFEAIIVENGSEDDTFDRLDAISKRDSRFKIIQLSRNFRMDGGLTAGLSVVDSDAVVLMAADLQDPPEMIPAFVERWESGYENVYGIVTSRRGTGKLRRFNSRLFYWIIGKLTGNLIPANASDFRLLDRRVYEQVRTMEERNRFVRGLVAWVGFRSIGVEHEREERFAGTSKAHSIGVLQLAVKAIFAHSQVPLIMIPLVGVGLFVVSLFALVGLSIDWLIRGVPFPGFGTIVALMIMLFGILFCLLGIVSIYIGLIYDEVKARPNFVIRQTLGVGETAGPGPKQKSLPLFNGESDQRPESASNFQPETSPVPTSEAPAPTFRTGVPRRPTRR